MTCLMHSYVPFPVLYHLFQAAMFLITKTVFKGPDRVIDTLYCPLEMVIFQFKKAAIRIFMNVSYPTLLAF